jgi:hypothetical protein
MYNQQSFSSSNTFGTGSLQNQYSSFGGNQTTSQYRGIQKMYQPTGLVQSVYGQNQQNQQNQQYQQNQYSGQFNQSPQSFHTSNYRGSQTGHDSYLHSDAKNPSQSGFSSVSGMKGTGFTSSYSSGFGSTGVGSQYSAGRSSYGAGQGIQSFHTANYQGNQPGHDSSWRADSAHPSSSAGSAWGQNQSQQLGQTGQWNQYQTQSQYQSPQSFHSTNYAGNQSNHDQQWRSDSHSPFQSQFGSAWGK